MNKKLSLAFSTCPNDTFIFHALAHGLIECGGLEFDISLADVEQLNQDARSGRHDVSKLSFAAFGQLADKYALLRSGAALGRGCGPLVIAKPDFDMARLPWAKIAVPGMMTTAWMLFGMYMSGWFAKLPNVTALTFDRIMQAVSEGEFDVGVIIHEGRFTYQEYGLVQIVDLGKWWEDKTGLPIPLGCIAVRRDVDKNIARMVERAISDSLSLAMKNPKETDAYVKKYAMEISSDVIRQHIALYVNDYSLDLGEDGKTAVSTLFDMAADAGLVARNLPSLFAA